MSKALIDTIQPGAISTTEGALTDEHLAAPAGAPQQHSSARLLGQPEGPFGTAVVSNNTILLRSLGAARFSRFETAELAPNALFICVPNTLNQPFQEKSTLLEFQLFLGEPQSPGSCILKGIGRIEEIKSPVDVPVPTPSGYIFRILQLGGEELSHLEKYVHDQLLKAAM